MIYTNEYGHKEIALPKLNISRYHSEFDDIIIDDRSNVSIISEESYMDILGSKLKIYETPGHYPSCLTFKIDKYLFTGEAFIPGIKVFTSFKSGNKHEAQKSSNKILSLFTQDTVICPGHGNTVGFVDLPKLQDSKQII